jgi:hypothetical protein
LKGRLKCKGRNNGDKGHHEPIEDTKKEPYQKKLHPKTLRCNNSIKPLKKKLNFKKQNKTKQNKKQIKPKKKTSSWNLSMMVGPKHHPKGALDSTPTTPLIFALHCTYFLVDEAIAFLCMLHCDGWLVFGKCKQTNFWAMVDIDIAASE